MLKGKKKRTKIRFTWCSRLFFKTICLSMTLIATFSPLLLLKASLTLENVPSPMVLLSLYFPIFLGDTITLLVSGFLVFPNKLFLTMLSVHAAYVSFLLLISIQFIYRRTFFSLFSKKSLWSFIPYRPIITKNILYGCYNFVNIWQKRHMENDYK